MEYEGRTVRELEAYLKLLLQKDQADYHALSFTGDELYTIYCALRELEHNPF